MNGKHQNLARPGEESLDHGIKFENIWEHERMKIWYTQDIISYYFCRLPIESA